MVRSLEGQIALVTGATRGIGKGIALQLGEAGAIVYITGRTLKSTNGLGSLEQTAEEIRKRGGTCVPVQVDHEKDDEIERLFKRIEQEQDGRLDILVNNAYKGVQSIFLNSGTKFWEQSPEIWDEINNVGLRNHYICTVYASRLMVRRKRGLIVTISSIGSIMYLFNVPYGAGKAACDKLASDCGIELKKFNVASVSLMVGAVKTELVTQLSNEKDSMHAKDSRMKEVFENAESIEFAGKVVVSLASDPQVMKYTSKVIVCEDYAQAKGICDIDGRTIDSWRQINQLHRVLPNYLKFIANLIPNFIKVPYFLVSWLSSKY